MLVKRWLPIRNQSGFSLLEVVASVVILSIILISFFQLIIQSNTVVQHNSDRFVLINLADAELERLQAMQFTSIEQFNQYISSRTTQTIADKQFSVQINKEAAKRITSPNGTTTANEATLNLYNVTVTVSETIGKKTSSSVAEGYVEIDAK